MSSNFLAAGLPGGVVSSVSGSTELAEVSAEPFTVPMNFFLDKLGFFDYNVYEGVISFFKFSQRGR